MRPKPAFYPSPHPQPSLPCATSLPRVASLIYTLGHHVRAPPSDTTLRPFTDALPPPKTRHRYGTSHVKPAPQVPRPLLLKWFLGFCMLDHGLVGAQVPSSPPSSAPVLTLNVADFPAPQPSGGGQLRNPATNADFDSPKRLPQGLPGMGLSPQPPCATPVDFVLVLDESGSMQKPKPDGGGGGGSDGGDWGDHVHAKFLIVMRCPPPPPTLYLNSRSFMPAGSWIVSEKAVSVRGAMGVVYTATPNAVKSPTLLFLGPCVMSPKSCHSIENVMWEPGMANSELRMWHQEV